MLIPCYATWLQVHKSGTKIKEYITSILGCVKERLENGIQCDVELFGCWRPIFFLRLLSVEFGGDVSPIQQVCVMQGIEKRAQISEHDASAGLSLKVTFLILFIYLWDFFIIKCSTTGNISVFIYIYMNVNWANLHFIYHFKL